LAYNPGGIALNSSDLVIYEDQIEKIDKVLIKLIKDAEAKCTKEIARLVGESEFSVLFHQGKKDHIHLCLIGDRTILAVIFDDRTTIGMVRLYAREVSEDLTKILSSTEKNKESKKTKLDSEFARSVENKLDDIFKD
jgi:predicted regulator of Ras-like GTPase activity (Roadblock/LC7/MglB family)